MRLNRVNVEKLISVLEAMPARNFNMEFWLASDAEGSILFSKPDGTPITAKEAVRPGCGTVGCIRGWAELIMLNETRPDTEIHLHNVKDNEIEQWLGISDSAPLFHGWWYSGTDEHEAGITGLTKLPAAEQKRLAVEELRRLLAEDKDANG